MKEVEGFYALVSPFDSRRWAGANGFSSRMLLGTPRDAQSPAAAPVM